MPAIPTCVDKQCPTNSLPPKDRRLFCFPRSDNLRRQWLERMDRCDLMEFTYTQLYGRRFRVCERHFKTQQFQTPARKKLCAQQIPRRVANSEDNPDSPVNPPSNTPNPCMSSEFGSPKSRRCEGRTILRQVDANRGEVTSKKQKLLAGWKDAENPALSDRLNLKSTFTYRGLIAPVFTVINERGVINTEIIPKYAKYLSDNGIKGLLVNGTSGEGMSLNVTQRKVLAEKWMEVSKETKQHIMIQIGGAPLPDVLELAKHAEKIGANSILCLPELYFKPTSIHQLTNYLKLVAEAAPKTPLLYYHIPGFTNVYIHMGDFLTEIDGKIPTFSGIKFTSEVIDEGLEAVNAHNKKFAVFLGADTLMYKAYQLGFDSSIATTFNMFPQLGVKIYENIKNGNVQEAENLQKTLTQVVSKIIKHGTWVPTMKAAMNLFSPIKVGSTLNPLIPLNLNQQREMKEDLDKLLLCNK
ncbi:N-acetylneuraminate lyase-like [Onthophagus taurus]|uniref:N-acetylneuraminate lyase-like n=1 Tax=Onthophagus taurus TaxID=166361 RepID=UPI0039BDF9F2